MAQRVKRLHVIQETRVQSLGQEVPLEKEMATHSSISEALFQEDSRFLLSHLSDKIPVLAHI